MENKAFPFSVEETDGRPVTPECQSNQPNTENTVPPIKLIVKYANLEQETADVISAPLLAKKVDLNSLNVTKALRYTAGDRFSNIFDSALNGRTSLKAGSLFEIPVVQESHSLKCKIVILIALEQWNRATGSSVTDLKKGICNLLGKCHSKNVNSVAMSAIGTGIALAFPPEVAAKIIGEELKNFVAQNPNTSIKQIQIVTKQLPENQTIFIAFRETLCAIDFGNRIIVCNEQGVPFPRTQLGDQVQKQIGNLSVSAVYEDIVKETTNAIVNSTNFKRWSKGSVAHSIFSVTGQEVIREAQRGHKSGKKVVMTNSANLKCHWILHCNCEGNIETLKHLLDDLFKLCDETGLKSLSLPAIGTGECMLPPKRVAETMIEAICSLARKQNHCLLNVRLVAFTPFIYHIFCTELQRLF
ncbi:protein mono-ADP-ribosyltransferase PARP14-like isoform X2 [Rana temporaria]|uniref:protein mono-ADP-ribosyltransferase PARP14-like isoform X2 n=1 Tax=Rana temporaria TaxID=8407 RepID=UPI001AAD78B1|nr:protein mono-ADP-ribosyltransferase PARP14-like isoform X2 [Rana temporaria]